MGRIRRLAAAATLVAACDQSPTTLDPFDIRLDFDHSPGSYCGEGLTCRDYDMTCNAVVMLVIYDQDQGGLIHRGCDVVEKDPNEDLCALKNVSPGEIFMIRPHLLRVSVAVWREGVLPDNPLECPPEEEVFDLGGGPIRDFVPRPAFAGSTHFKVGGDQKEAVVPLSCSEPSQLVREDCTTNVETTLLLANVDDIDRGFDVTTEQANQLGVGAAEPTVFPGIPQNEVVIEQTDTFNLRRQEGEEPPLFSSTIEGTMGETVCAVVRDSEPESTTSAACSQFDAGVDPLDLRGILVPKPKLGSILSALDLGQFPDQGLVVGRVLDASRQPLAGVSLTPETGTVQYLSADLSKVAGSTTSESGYFVSTDAPFGTRWTAYHAGTDVREQGEPRAGLVRKKVSALIVHMQTP